MCPVVETTGYIKKNHTTNTCKNIDNDLNHWDVI